MQEQPLVAEHKGGTWRSKTTAAATAAHTRYLSSPAATTLHGKTQRFVLRLPPQNIARATFMQPSQCVLQHHVANLHVSTHMATPDDNNHAAIPMRSAHTETTTRCRTQRRNQFTDETPPAAHRWYLSSPAATTLHGKTHGFVLQLPPQHKAPCNIHAAITMRFAA